jgi:hypothetical protein
MSNNILLEENKETINDSYNYIKNKNIDLYHQTNPNTLFPIVNSLNQNLKKFNFEQNQYNVLNNLNQEALYKKEQLLRLHNDDLSKQLSILDTIQANISNKDKLIEQTNLSINDYDININISIFIIIISIVLFASVIYYGFGVISPSLLKIIFIVIMVLYIISLMFVYNILNFREILNKKTIQKAAYEIKYIGDKIYSDTQNQVNQLKTEWIDANCNCPVQQESTNIYAIPDNDIVKEFPGLFYYDGTAPQQLLFPPPDPFKLNLTQQIEWPDYSPDGSVKYNPTINQLEYSNKNYYNYANNKVPVIMDTPNFITKPLTNSVTYTANL